jgi:myo-inositol catabolism protein IolC
VALQKLLKWLKKLRTNNEKKGNSNCQSLVQEMYELGIEPEFWSKATEAAEAVA